ncbi:MAG: glycosyltransferase [Scytonematopsis contorta HA4267-MV1]|jgi:rhamnosyltransferase|nr:glycosyltransferase [Scytonematopsis contorta HA4267-MV1]
MKIKRFTKHKVAAYITAYENPEAVKFCLEALRNQSFPIKKVLIVDNSKEKPLLHLKSNNDIIIKFHPDNIGISAALDWAISWTIDQEYDFLWAFDQDSLPHKDCLKKLICGYHKFYRSNYKIGIIAPLGIDLRNNQFVEAAKFSKYRFIGYKPTKKQQYCECDSPITSGSLISVDAIKNISLPIVDLFIDGVDMEYSLQLRQKGFYNIIIPQATIYHELGYPIQIKFLQKEFYIQQYSAFRQYYISRNHTYIETRHAKGLYRIYSCLWRIKYMLLTTLWIQLYDVEDKWLKICACLLGTYHGFIGKLGKIWH